MASTTETWGIETGARRILRYGDGSFSSDHATCYFARTTSEGENKPSPEDGELEYSLDGSTWRPYAAVAPQGVSAQDIYDAGGTVQFRLRVDGNVILSLATAVQDYAPEAAIDVQPYADGSTQISVGADVAARADYILLTLARDGVAVATDTVPVVRNSTGTHYYLAVSPTGIVKTAANTWQDFSRLTVTVSKQTGGDPVTVAGSDEVGVYYRLNDGLPSGRVPLENGVAVISGTAFPASTTTKIEVFITAGEASDPVLASQTVSIVTNRQVAGHTGRFYYYAGMYDPSVEYRMDDTQAPYVKCRDGNFYMLDFGGRENVSGTSLDDDPSYPEFRDGNPWTLMRSTMQYYIAKAVFGEYAGFGSFIINGDWLISTKGTRGANRDSSEYRKFDPACPGISVKGTHTVNGTTFDGYNFVPNFAVDGLTGRTYQNAATVRGNVYNPFTRITEENCEDYFDGNGQYFDIDLADTGYSVQIEPLNTSYVRTAGNLGTGYVLNMPYPREKDIGVELSILNLSGYPVILEGSNPLNTVDYYEDTNAVTTRTARYVIPFRRLVRFKAVDISGDYCWIVIDERDINRA